MKNKLLLLTSVMFLGLLSSCNKKEVTLTFEKEEYIIHSGDAVLVKEKYKGITYEMIGNNYEGITLDSESGTFTYDDNVPNSTQVMYVASYKDTKSIPVVVTLMHEYEVANITFQNLSNYIVDGEFITASASLPYAVTYKIKERVPGITINESTGKVSFTSHVADGTKFEVIASSHNGAHNEQAFYAMTENFVRVEDPRQVVEKNGNVKATFVLDFSDNVSAKEQGVLALTNEQNIEIDKSNYSYDNETSVLRISADYLNSLYDGVNNLKIITSRNAVAISVEIATKFIFTAEDLASINDSQEALEGYYILMNDIDMTSYFAENSKGYNDGKGWTPIGLYQDVSDPNIATKLAFKGTFDGNGYVIRNLYANRKDVNSFNAGLFGYTTSSAVIKNLGVTGSLNVSSYSGGFIGSNSGTITNCWADVDVQAYTGDVVYRYLGGFAGNNFGTIENCYAIGDVLSDISFGAFIGMNEGVVANCYAFKNEHCEEFIGYGLVEKNCVLFENKQIMQEADWSNLLPSRYWDFNGNLPQLKEMLDDNIVRRIEIDRSLLKDDFFDDNPIEVKVNIYPKRLQEIYLPMVTYSVDKNGGVSFDGNILNTLNYKDRNITIHASLEVDGVEYKDTITFTIKTSIVSLELITNVTTMKAGYSYRLGCSYLPEDATEGITYHVMATNLSGVTLVKDVLTLDEDVVCDSLTIYATTNYGNIRSNSITVSVSRLTRIDTVKIYEKGEDYLKFDFDDSLDLTDLHVTYFNKTIKYSVENGNIVKVSKDYLEDSKNMRVPFIFQTNNGQRFIADAYYFAHEKYDEKYVTSNYINAIEISSKEDFAKYFNIYDLDESRYQNYYDKVFYLSADIDFEGDEIHSIGYSSDSKGSQLFSGKLFGCGHTISNYKIISNELFYDKGTSQYDPCYFGVGLFGAASGEFYDINITNARVTGKGLSGGLVGILNGGKIENCYINNSTITSSGHSKTTIESDGSIIYVGGIVGRVNEGQTIACYYNNSTKNAIG